MDAIILASSSPRRKELLEQAGIPFRVVPGGVDEDKVELSGTPGQKAEHLAYVKAQDVAKNVEKGLVLGADTIVVCDGEVFGKPSDEADARRMLEKLNGREHHVITGVSIIDTGSGKVMKGYETTKVRFARLKPEEIQAYIDTGEPFGKAGAYAVQGKGALLVEGLDGCYSNVVGLPLQRVSKMLKELGISVLQ
jgi:septum formation protein